MSWSEFSTLLSGLMPDTPLGQVISIRSENDKNILKHFTKAQHRIRNEWRSKRAKQLIFDKKDAEKQIKQLQEIFKQAFS